MKKALLFSVLNLTVGVTLSCAQGTVLLDNYYSSVHPLITYGPGSGGTLGAGIQDGFTVGLYFGEGAFAGSVAADPSGTAIPTSLHPSLQLGIGQGSTATAYTSVFNTPGQFTTPWPFLANSVSGRVSTFIVVAYDGASYSSSTVRGHSAAFEMLCLVPDPLYVGDFMPAFQVNGVPEPSTLTLTGLGLASLLLARRRNKCGLGNKGRRMKKSLMLAILGLTGGVISSYAQGYIGLDNYNVQSSPLVTYGPLGGGTLGAGINSSFTVGLYFGEGAFAASVPADPDPFSRSIPTSMYASFILGTGSGSTAQAETSGFGVAGEFSAVPPFQANSVAGGTSTFMVVAFNGPSYASSTIRGHSTAFQMVCNPGNVFPLLVGEFMSTFQVNAPEPSTLTLTGLGLASLLFARRRK